MREVKLLCGQMIVLSCVQKISGETMVLEMDWETKKKIKKNQFIKDLKQLVDLNNSVCHFQSLPMILFAHGIQGYV